MDAEELWLWHAGSPVVLLTAAHDTAIIQRTIVGGAVLAGETPQARVPAHHWQAAEARNGWALVSCVVVPGFDFAGFTMAPSGWSPG